MLPSVLHARCLRPILQQRRQVFKNIRQQATEAGLVRSVFTFVDASAIVTKQTTWAERDRALADGAEALNNRNVSQYSADPDARFGCKGTDRFWYGYKRHVSVDMRSGLIRAVAVTPANVPDHRGLRHICPDGGMVVGDKGYCPAEAQRVLRAHGCHDGTIKRRHMRHKDPDKDRWLTKLRTPFESVFSQQERRARYRGWAKVQLQAFLEAIVFNVKRLLQLHAPPLYTLGA
jgi:IS5 family transposase